MDKLEETKLLILLAALESALERENAEEMMGIEMLNKFSDIRKMIQGWLAHESPLTHEQRVQALAVFTDVLNQKKQAVERNDATLH